MKKAVLILAALLLVSSFVFAQDAKVTVGAWGRGIFIPVDSELKTMTGVSWGNATRVGMTISGTSPNVGFQADFNVDINPALKVGTDEQGPQVSLGDNQKIWIKPMDMITLQIGKFHDETLRLGAGAWGGAGFTDYAGKIGDDAVFKRIDGKNIEVAVKPIDGLYIFAALGGILGNGGDLTTYVLAKGQYGAGYTIPGIGTVSAQFIGETLHDAEVNAAFKLTAIEKLTVAVGGFYNIEITPNTTNTETMRAALDASYSLDAITINAMGYVSLPKTGDLAFEAGVGGSYNLGDGLGIDADFRFQNDAKAGKTNGTQNGGIGATVALQKGFSNGKLGVALQVTNGNFGGAGSITKTPNEWAWTLPVKFEYSL